MCIRDRYQRRVHGLIIIFFLQFTSFFFSPSHYLLIFIFLLTMPKFYIVAIIATIIVILYLMFYFSLPEKELQDNNYYRFQAFKYKYEKQYSEEEEQYRYKIFVENLNYILEYNNRQTGVILGINKFADLTRTEFDLIYKGYIPVIAEQEETHIIVQGLKDLPSSVDWRTQGAVTPIKDQGQCGSCWAFSTVFSLEGIYALKNQKLLSFSEQQLVDCSLLNLGCNGGNTGTAMDYEQDHGTILESDYPYVAEKQSCEADKKTKVFYPKSHTKVQSKNNDELAQAVAQQPVSVCIDASSDVFEYYTSGVIKDSSCGTSLDHCVGIVGYQNDESQGGPYWIVKNSWGTDWGEEGYVRILKQTGTGDGICGIAKDAIYPNYN
eukprot:TRINITY_DN5_c0_g4_i3.p1 TRINITY_DN5_c0_g4~~TRINITY_DN5_c0_g4_i3.p1  ORF type:complete len:379 (+),score=76.15 TRINITY_DN5_c0_g4_i3:102-1238(+)